jgi:hypothetical protein
MTAEDIFLIENGYKINHRDVKKAMIEFAKYHVEKALKTARIEAVLTDDVDLDGRFYNVVDSESIINSYQLENIK